jgi:hypothetical protein
MGLGQVLEGEDRFLAHRQRLLGAEG